MHRVRLGLVVASIGVGALLAGWAAVPGRAQTSSPSLAGGLRPGLEEEPALSSLPRRGGARRGAAEAARSARFPRYGNPPGSGAGVTGFVSNNPRRTKPRPGARNIPGLPQPLIIAPMPPGATAAAAPAAGSAGAPAPPATAAAAAGLTAASVAEPRRAVRQTEAPPIIAPDIRGPAVRRGLREEDPFDAVGVRAGSFVLRPAIEVMGGYDSNPARVTGGKGSSVLIVAPELKARSNWSRHELTADLRGSYTAYGQASSLNRPYFDGRLNGRIDVSRQTQIDLEGRYLVATDNPGSPDLPAGLAKLPIYTTLGATAGVAHRFNRFELALKGSTDRVEYENSKLTNGASASNRDRNYDQYGAQLRASYELRPGIKPFAEIAVDTRIRDLSVDAFGVQRDSDGHSVKAGTTFEFSRKLTGEAGVGYLVRTYKDPTLPDLRGVIADASLIWAASPLTTVKLTAKSTADESTLPGVSGVLRRDAVAQVDHAFRRWLIGTAKIGYGMDAYQGSPREDHRSFASLGLTYKLTRTLQVKGELRQEWLRSNVPGNDYTASVALVGLRLQR